MRPDTFSISMVTCGEEVEGEREREREGEGGRASHHNIH